MYRVSAYKILSNLEFLKRKMPMHLNIDMAGICNLRCGWCFFKGGIDENTDVMRDPELRKHIIDDKKIIEAIWNHQGYNGKAITFVGGGEPLLHPKASIIMKSALAFHHVGLITNLSMTLSDELVDTLNKCDWIRVSLDASTSKTYEAIHGIKAFNKTIHNMGEIKPRVLGISFLVHQTNYKDIEGIFEIAQEVNADYVQFKPVYQHEEDLKGLPGIADVNLLIRSSIGDYEGEIINEYGSRLGILTSKDRNPVTKEPYPHVPCLISKYRVHIASDGEVYPCCIYKYSREYSYGSIYKKQLIDVLRTNQRKSVDKKLYIDKCPICWDKDCQQRLNELQYDDLLFV